jgi:hypothetical protein
MCGDTSPVQLIHPYFTLTINHVHANDRNTASLSHSSRLGGVGVSVLATGPKVAGSNPAKAMDFLKAIKICSTSSSQMGSKAGRSHVVRFYSM